MTDQTYPPTDPSEPGDDYDYDPLQVDDNPEATAAYEDTLQFLRLRSGAKTIRQEKGLTQTDVASSMGTTQSAVSDIESGRVDAQLSTWQRYARAIGKQFGFSLLGEKTPPTREDQPDSNENMVLTGFALAPVLTKLSWADAAQSLSAISKETNLPEIMVSHILEQLGKAGWTTAKGEGTQRSFKLEDEAATGIGVSLHRDRVTAVLTDLEGTLITGTSYPIATSTPEIVREAVVIAVKELWEYSTKEVRRSVLGVGVSLAGVIDTDTGEVKTAPDLQSQDHGWEGEQLRRHLEQEIQTRVHSSLRISVSNDVNALAIWHGMQKRGADKQTSHPDPSRGSFAAVILINDCGIGAALISDGKIIHGANSATGEIGHVIVDFSENAPACQAAKKHSGCLETVATVQGILSELDIETDSIQTRLEGLRYASDKILSHDTRYRDAFYKAGTRIGRAVLLLELLDPDEVAIYASPYLYSAPPIAETVEPFQIGITKALTDAKNTQQISVDPDLQWYSLNNETIAVAASMEMYTNFLNNPVTWYPDFTNIMKSDMRLTLGATSSNLNRI
ncbi:ROK family protein [Arthrobacter psychrochitiniphilus]|uniref:HTH cro/C1-type domain-containing protein n=1 Tax=Arthrobacter psychrochitiniphilus TaxID=291045 RepID=A0A2V3DTR1_9MICC|nr:ROK family protein [Arthrobacter psychrochitiniphilus]NYG16079.1 putative NBD/HSP70 family sugar kinase/transcriptional regulator with XRE-family HTH domain [Arthrobacter psychrochitiniphilus]PXA63958.1 hypothetical protein CVS29_17745 [Arthrobacter psychrochitiniphilus]